MKNLFKTGNSRLTAAFFLALTFIVSLTLSIIGLTGNLSVAQAVSDARITNVDYKAGETSDSFVHLSSLDYITENNWSYNGWSGHEIQKDKNQEGGALSLMVDGEKRTFAKGISVHAKGQVTYDISALSADYPRFTAKLGVDASRGSNGNLRYTVYLSDDGATWESVFTSSAMTGATNCAELDINVINRRYLRIYVDPLGSNAADHGTIANPKLVTTDYVVSDIIYDKIKKLDYYDDILRREDAEFNYENNYRLVLEREVVNKLNYWVIQSLAETSPDVVNVLDWILSNNRILEEVIEVSEITKPAVFLEVLANLYKTYTADLQTENGYVYEKMMIGLAAAYSTDDIASPLVYKHVLPDYDYILRYALVKQLFQENKFAHTDWFKEFHVEFMRNIMQDALRADETLWFSNYVRVIKKGATGPYSYMGYVTGNFILPGYFEETNRATYDNKFHLSEFDVPYGDKPTARYWMVFQHGGICWNLARTGQSVQKILGLPSTSVFQPSHEAFLIYTRDEQNRGFWYLGNNNYGWGRSSTTWYGTMRNRLLFNWGAKSFVNHSSTTAAGATNAGYQYLAQANLNRYDEFKKSIYLNLIANSYTDNNRKIDTYNKALDSIELNLDSYDYLIKAYTATDKTSAEWQALGLRIIDAYTFYPQAMYDLLKLIKPHLSGSALIDINIKERAAMERASHATNADIWQDLAAREIANAHLGKTQANIASFSFDGENAGKIVIDPAYDDYDFGWRYRIDGVTTSPTEGDNILAHSYQLSKEELAQITSANDIHIFIDGNDRSRPTYTIDILDGVLPAALYGNDYENRVVGVDLTLEWRNGLTDEWTPYAQASPNNWGDKTLYVRAMATGNRLPSEAKKFTFTADNQPLERKYVAVSHLSIEGYSTQSIDTARPFYAPNAIDGNLYTLWHTDFRENVLTLGQKPFITIKLDKPRYISAVEFQQHQYKENDPDSIKAAKVYVSENNESWTEAGKIENCPLNSQDLQVIDFAEYIYCQYIKLEFDTYNMFASLALVNIFQDLTSDPRPTGGIGYSTTNPVNGNVIARLVNVSVENYTILSEGGDTHVFTENGEFTFRFVDKDTRIEGSAVARVDWIDKTAPTATIEYSESALTNHTVIATLKPDKDVTVTNNGLYEIEDDGSILDQFGNVIPGYSADKDGNVLDSDGNIIANLNKFTYEFIDNGEFTFEFVDKAGNHGSATAKVNWIDRNAPVGTVTYDINESTDKSVTATVNFDKQGVTITNNNGSNTVTFTENGEFMFEFVDRAGNFGTASAKVTWIDGGSGTPSDNTKTVVGVVVGVVVGAGALAGGAGVFVYLKKFKKK